MSLPDHSENERSNEIKVDARNRDFRSATFSILIERKGRKERKRKVFNVTSEKIDFVSIWKKKREREKEREDGEKTTASPELMAVRDWPRSNIFGQCFIASR